MRTLANDPDDTTQVFTIIEALSGATNARIVRGFERDAVGRTLLAERPRLLPRLADRAALGRLPAGSLGRAYLAFVDAEGITADGLEAAADEGQVGLHAEGSREEFVGERMRVTHDLWHTVTGYHGDVVGEVSLLAFSLAQIWNLGVGVIVGIGLTQLGEREAVGVMLDGYRRGARAAWLPSVPWERLLHVPIDEVRARLGVDALRPYTVRRSSQLRTEGKIPMRAQPPLPEGERVGERG
jgi:ubiquinone biosynthesis protein COQ4